MRRILGRVENLSLGPFGIGLIRDAEAAAASSEVVFEGFGVEIGGTATTPDSLLGLRFKLEQKLTYIAKHMLGSPGGPTFLTIGSLEYDGYLKPNEARTASRILTLSEVEFESLSGSQQRTFLRDGAKLVDNIRARMLFALARSEARKADWEVQELPRKPRPDLVIEKGDRSYRVTTVFALSADSRFLRGPLKRLGALSDPVYTLKLIVVPHQSSASDRDVPAGMEIVTIDTFKKMLRDA